MSTIHRIKFAGVSGNPETCPAVILMVDFNLFAEIGEQLESLLCAMTAPPVVVRESLRGYGSVAAIEKLTAAVARTNPDLLILLFGDDASACAPSIFNALLEQARSLPILAVPALPEADDANELYQLGANDYVIPPFRSAEVYPRIRRLLAYGPRQKTTVAILKESLGVKQFVGESPALMQQVQKIPQIARCDVCVLITGETGTGKEVCARAIHYLSSRSERPFVPLNCGAIPIDLLENELFGHEAGAFTGANGPHAGVICEANGGSLFLDEIDSLPLSAQTKLLRFLQDKEYRPLGARKAVKADVRIIAASNARMDELLATGKMRRDLYYRLNVLAMQLPPLRQRKEDIPLLARHFLVKFAHEIGAPARDIAPSALRKLSLHDWPGNVRELENVIGRAVALCQGELIQSREIDLPLSAEPESDVESFNELKAKVITEFEQHFLRSVLARYQGNIAQAARAAQKNRRAFFQLMRKHRIRAERPNVPVDGQPVGNVVIQVDKEVHSASRP